MIGALLSATKAANPAGALFSLLWKPALLALVLGGLFWFARHGGYEDAKQEAAGEIASLKAQLQATANARDTAVEANDRLAETLQALKEANEDWASEKKRLQAEAEAGRAKLAKAAEIAREDAETWRARYARESAKPKCQQAREALAAACPALEGF